ncbi:MAG TPA: WhiB family transcriptional regulator [Actinocrinis sp.]|jgi:WhiB family redox-sensing transcriptional regulator|uniref:WhiB family transcriptional regulator n=1 Tax=Actinocrinis sp. TaxID=1920516 RepID=UPI002DDCF2B4|nr:WhiB family transcriptional regulator [Actinocrinis sp.]HEV3170079.1 WhiB family transcriptional regulator [Actinocrinis sp.]
MSPSGSEVLATLAPVPRAARPRSAPDVYTRLDVAWQERGACRQVDSSLFFAPEGEGRAQRRFRESAAKAVCAYCPVRVACRSFALATGEPYGIWGGTTETERLRRAAGRRHKAAESDGPPREKRSTAEAA